MRTPSAFEWSVVRVVPHVEREEFVNAGVVVFCHDAGYLAARIALDERRLRAIAPSADVTLVQRHLDAIPIVCAGGPAAGPLGALDARERFRWLVAPRSTVIQLSPAHAGITDAPERLIDHLIETLVRVRT